MSSRQRNLEQERAKRAWECVAEAKRRAEQAKEYGGLARRAAADLHTSGLGQTLAFLRAKGYKNGSPQHNGHSLLLDHVSGWVTTQLGVEGQDLLEWVAKSAGSDEYRRATAEAVAFCAWLKRFAEAELAAGDGNERQ